MNTIKIEDLDSASIRDQAKIDGITEVTELGNNGKPADAHIAVYQFGDVRVATTNGDPIWEEGDPQDFADMLEEEGIEL